MEFKIYRTFTFLTVLCCFLLCACVKGESEISPPKFVAIEDLSNFYLSIDGAPVLSPPSHGVLIDDEPSKYLLTDGRVVQSEKRPKAFVGLKVVLDKAAEVSNLPPSALGDKKFQWYSELPSGAVSITGMSQESYFSVPGWVARQGRNVEINSVGSSFYLPFFKIKWRDSEGWVSASHLQFVPSSLPTRPSGLIQKPFLNIAGDKSRFFPEEEIRYLELSGEKIQKKVLPALEWTIEQLLLLPSGTSTNIESVALLTSKDNCSVFAVSWRNKNKKYFGYCKEGVAGPTPVLNFYSEDAGFLNLGVVEVLGDSELLVSYQIAPLHNGEAWLKLMSQDEEP